MGRLMFFGKGVKALKLGIVFGNPFLIVVGGALVIGTTLSFLAEDTEEQRKKT